MICATGLLASAHAENTMSRTEVATAVIDTLNGFWGPGFGPNDCIPGNNNLLANDLNDRLACEEITPKELAELNRPQKQGAWEKRCGTVSDLVEFAANKCKNVNP